MNNLNAWSILQHQYFNKSGFVLNKIYLYTLLWQCSIINTLTLQPSPQHIPFFFGWQARNIKRGRGEQVGDTPTLFCLNLHIEQYILKELVTNS